MNARHVRVSLGALLATVACNSGSSPPSVEVARSAKLRVTAPVVSDGDAQTAAADDTAFALELFQLARAKPGNVVFSPLSLSLALAMTYGGARGDTETEMAKALHFTLPQESLHPAFDALDLALASRGAGANGVDGQPFRLTINNAVWAQAGHPFLEPYLDLLAVNYGAGVRLADFAHDAEGARAIINGWVGTATGGHINDLLRPGILTPNTVLVLTNAVTFNAAWSRPFLEPTRDRAFHRLDGTDVQAATMFDGLALFTRGDGYEAAELRYSDPKLSMIVILPDYGTSQAYQGPFEAFERGLTPAVLAGIVDGIGTLPIDSGLYLPRFKLQASLDLKETLTAMGMPSAFSGAADFSGMDGARELFVSDVVHQAFISVGEQGTEAAAATAVPVSTKAATFAPMIVDRPFLFLIRDRETGAILFLGHVLDPTAG
ncbi:MAG: peptidase [Myxococcales bacterium]|nr:peptidase [Myxococcales bacterium]